jgi:Heterokaryon incompatibility protein (HET)
MVWYNHCRRNHIGCENMLRAEEDIPSRLVYLPPTDQSSFRLLTADDLRTEQVDNTHYMTLSHCWGELPFLTLTSTTSVALRQTTPVNTLPQTFQQAIMVARHLGCSLLWIDSLCILQDSINDWQAESRRMASIYLNAVCNIAATASYDTFNGLFRGRDPKVFEPCLVQTAWKDAENGLVVLTNGSEYTDEIWYAPLNQRAWVFQERYLSRRKLHFGRGQVYWQCQQDFACEGQPFGLFPDLSLLGPRMTREKTFLSECARRIEANNLQKEPEEGHLESFWDTWQVIVSTYSRCKLTRESDKLAALLGIVDLLRRAYLDDNIAGIWRGHLPAALLWRRQLGMDLRPQYAGHNPRRSSRAPSWSWASIDGGVWADTLSDLRGCSYELLSVVKAAESSTNIENDRLVVTGFVRLRSPTISVHYVEDYDDSRMWNCDLVIGAVQVRAVAMLDTPMETPDFPATCGLVRYWQYDALPEVMGKQAIEGLLLQPTKGQDNQYTRIGYCQIRFSPGEEPPNQTVLKDAWTLLELCETKEIILC